MHQAREQPTVALAAVEVLHLVSGVGSRQDEMTTTRAQAVNDKLTAILAMMEAQQAKQEELLVRMDGLSAQWQKSQEQFEELQCMWEHL